MWKATGGRGERRYKYEGCTKCVLYWRCTRKVEKREHGAKDTCSSRRVYSPGKLGKEQPGGTQGRLWGRSTGGPQEVKGCGCRIRKREPKEQGIGLGVMKERNATKGQHGGEQGKTKGRRMLQG